jgi:hypothetical protein
MDLVLAVLLASVAVMVTAYWVSFYRGGEVRVTDDPCYARFQAAFPVADAWMAGCALVAAAGLVLGERFGPAFMLLAASAAVFLGLMDVTFNVENGLYRLVRTSGAMRFELLVNIVSLGLGAILIVYALPRLL